MGKIEKLVLLAVLFVAAVALAVSLNRGKAVDASGPMQAAEDVLDGSKTASDLHAPAPSSSAPVSALASETVGHDTGTSLLLNAGTEQSLSMETGGIAGGPAIHAEPESDPTQPILKERTGLRPSFLDDYMVYTVVAGDTWNSLAQRFYQDEGFVRNLQQANDDLVTLDAGKEILVPLFDFFQPAAGLQPSTSAVASLETPAPTTVGDPATEAARPAAPSTRAPATGTPAATAATYEVREGDTLSDISLAVFGSAGRWKEIYEANRDQLKSPEWLQVGMKLKLPAGAQASARVAKAEPKAAPKTIKPETKAATEPASATTAKKKKVL